MKRIIQFFTLILLTNCSDNKEIREIVDSSIKTILPKDSIHIGCLDDLGFKEKIDTIILNNSILTFSLGKYANCAYSKLDTLYLKNDTLNVLLTSTNNERIACDCYLKIYARLKYNYNIPKSITINGQEIGTGHGILSAEEK